MSMIRPFAALRPALGRAADVAAPPYDVVSQEEARARAEGRPWSFLHISRAEIDLPPGTDPYSPQVYARARGNLQAMERAGVLVRETVPCYYVYRLVMGEHTQTGLAATVAVEAYETGRVRRHELTRPDKEDDRVRQIDALNAQTGPVLLAYRHHPEVETLLATVTRGTPEMDVTAADGVRHLVWIVADPAKLAQLTVFFEGMERLYIADGHHRSAAAARVAALRKQDPATPAGDADHNYFLVVAFPDQEMRILDYNRLIKDLHGLSREDLLAQVARSFRIEPAEAPVRPTQSGEYGMYLPGQWYRLSIDPTQVPADPVARLDVSLLQDKLLAPLLGIGDPRRDKRIDFVGGIRGLAGLQERVDSGEMAVAFALYPTTLGDLMAVADAGAIMPPKSTWFEPKLADGLLSHVLDN
ncbi:DUF1015 domain-containing protein [Gammaproteobacteria bacterium]